MKIGSGKKYQETYYEYLRSIGKEFLHQDYYEIASGGTLNFLIDYTTHVSGKKEIHVIPGEFTATYGIVKINIYRGTGYNGGTLIPFYCTETQINTPFETTVKIGASGDVGVKGTKTEGKFAGFGSTNQSSGGSTVKGGSIFHRGNTGKTLIECVNESGKDVLLTYTQIFYEI